ncbi:hypothetical protein E4N76_07200 [Treponema putidum]|uniref:Uncharacterized protein n=1 Tax=Treponema putidum TaxID=221027 RepID=A0ABY5HV26_9SPIR|nr:hypothetical protein E4N76_07200 [Treponema putidum]UTY31234.1 hypothetical protein E4N75_06635 [Treponema putidum]
MKPKLCIYLHPSYLTSRTAIEAKSAVLHQKPYLLVQFLIISFAYAKLIRLKSPPSVAERNWKNKIEQSTAQSCLRKKLSLSEIPTDRTFENRPIKKVRPCTFFISEFYLRKTLEVITTAIRGGEAYRVYVELILRSDAADSVYIFKRNITS